MSLVKTILSGFVGACALSVINETVRQFVTDAPRLDILGKKAVALPMIKAGKTPPRDDELY